jgi:hypothetical protein
MSDWSLISAERFEQLCSFILESEGFYNIRRIGGSGDRGRDIMAQKEAQPIFGSKEIQNWVIQCKRYVTAPLSINEISSELNKVRMHNPDYYAIMISRTITSNVHDWLDEVKKQYPFRILIFDVDWLEKQLTRQPLLFKLFFENQEQSIVYSNIKTNTELQVYTAGKMPSEAVRGIVTWWRNDLEFEASKLARKIGFFHPEFAGCDHSGIELSQTVEQDFRMISQSNLIIAYLDNEDQFGTLTEIMIGHSLFKQIAIFIDSSIQTKISANSENEDGTMANQDYYDEVYDKLFKTQHSCPCNLMNELEPIHLNNYWFMVEFLRLRQPDTHIQMTTKNDVIPDMIKYLKTFIQ